MNIYRTTALGCIIVLAGMSLTALFGFGGCVADKASQDHRFFDIHKALDKDNAIPIVVIGSGPAGLSAALYGARGKFDTLVIQGRLVGGLLTETTEVENWPGEISIMGPRLMDRMQEQVARFGVEMLNDIVEEVDLSSWPFRITTEDGVVVYALSIVVATGAAPRKLGVPGEDTYWGLGVTSCATCDAPFFEGEDVVVIGGGDSAVEEALQLAKYARKVTILVRKGKMRAAARMQDRLLGCRNVEIKYNLEIKEILGDGSKVTGLKLIENGKKVIDMPISGVFLAIGHDPSTRLFANKIDLCPTGHIDLRNRTQVTSMPGVFAAGDVADNRYRQAVVSAGHGVSAALDAIEFLNEVGLTDEIAAKLTAKRMPCKANTQDCVDVVRITSLDKLNRIITDNKLVIVDFFAEYCPSCMQMLPVFESVANDFKGVRFVSVDADDGAEIMQHFSVPKVPYLLFFKNGVLIDQVKEVMSKKELREYLNERMSQI